MRVFITGSCAASLAFPLVLLLAELLPVDTVVPAELVPLPEFPLPEFVPEPLPEFVLPEFVLPEFVLPEFAVFPLPELVLEPLPEFVLPEFVLPEFVLPEFVLPEFVLAEFVLAEFVLDPVPGEFVVVVVEAVVGLGTTVVTGGPSDTQFPLVQPGSPTVTKVPSEG